MPLSFFHLPLELCSEIIYNLRVVSSTCCEEHRRSTNKVDWPSVRNASLTCQQLRAACLPVLFESVNVPNARLLDFLKFISNDHSQSAEYVKTLQFGLSPWASREQCAEETLRVGSYDDILRITDSSVLLSSLSQEISLSELWPSAASAYAQQAILQSLILTALPQLQSLCYYDQLIEKDYPNTALWTWKGERPILIQSAEDAPDDSTLSFTGSASLFACAAISELCDSTTRSTPPLRRLFPRNDCLKSLNLFDSVMNKHALWSLLASLPQLEVFAYKQTYLGDLDDNLKRLVATPRDFSEALLVRSDTLKTLRFEMGYEDASLGTPFEAMMPLGGMKFLQNLELAGSPCYSASERAFSGDPVFPLDWATMLPNSIEHLTFSLDDYDSSTFYASHLASLIPLAKDHFPRLKYLEVLRLSDDIEDALGQLLDDTDITLLSGL